MRVVALLLIAAGLVSASDVVDLTTANFDSTLKNIDLALVEFFAPWYYKIYLFCSCFFKALENVLSPALLLHPASPSLSFFLSFFLSISLSLSFYLSLYLIVSSYT